MNLTLTLHRISHLKWVFLIAQVGLIGYCFMMPDNLITMIGVLIYVSGVQLGLQSLSDVERMSANEIARFQIEGHAEQQSKFLLTSIVILIAISVLFMSLRFVFGERAMFTEFFSLGLDCWALILGILCMLKYIMDKKAHATSLSSK